MLEKLKEYKELISIIIFFLSGFIWLQVQFPKKSDLEIVQCRLDKNANLIQHQIRAQKLDSEIKEEEKELGAFSSGNPGLELSPAMRNVLDGKKATLSLKRNNLNNVTEAMEKIKIELQTNVCGKVKS